MLKRIIFILICAFAAVNCAYSEPAGHHSLSAIDRLSPFKKGERVLILAPHPDDEAIACAGVIQRALKAGARVQVAYLTNGDHNEAGFIVYEKRITFRKGEFIHMGEVRKNEAIKAMALLGVDKDNLIFLGYPDFGTFAIFSQYWRQGPPYKSLLTRISSVPYKEDLSFGSPYRGENILADLIRVLLICKPDKIFVSHPADVNVDHKTLYLFLQVALADLAGKIPAPAVYPYLVHCVGWPLPRHYRPALALGPPRKFLGSQLKWQELNLTPEELAKKHQAILCYRSQTESSAFYLLAFARRNELFSDYPEIELNAQAPWMERLPEFFGFSTPAGGFFKRKGEADFSLQDNKLLIRICKTGEMNRRFSILLYLFGYSPKTPFADMPKIRIATKYTSLKVFDGKRLIEPQGIELEFGKNELVLKIPLKVLGEPEFILTSLKAHMGSAPIATVAFRKVRLK